MLNMRRSLQWRNKQSISHSGKNNYLYGKTYEEFWGKEKANEIKKKRSIILKGRIFTEISKKRMSITGKDLIKKGKIKLFQVSLKGNKNQMYGKKRPDLVLRNKLITRKGIKRPGHSKFMKKWHKTHIHQQFWKPNYKLRFLNKDSKFIKKLLIDKKIRPNKQEKVIIDLIKKNNLPFKYVGDGSYMIGTKNPDFISNNEKKVIELFGDYYHNETKKDIPFQEPIMVLKSIMKIKDTQF